jgi:hypothetical protein
MDKDYSRHGLILSVVAQLEGRCAAVESGPHAPLVSFGSLIDLWADGGGQRVDEL